MKESKDQIMKNLSSIDWIKERISEYKLSKADRNEVRETLDSLNTLKVQVKEL